MTRVPARFLVAALILTAAATPLSLFAQTRDRARAGDAAPASDAAILAAGWNALAAGQADAAARSAAQILARTPWHHAATSLRVTALAATDPLRGLDAYETWLAKRTTEDAGLLEPVALALLRQIAAGDDAGLRRDAVRLLAASGVTVRSTDPLSQLAADAAKAREGDASAASRLQTAAVSPIDPGVVADAALAAGPAGRPALKTMLEQPTGAVRAAAVAALGRSHADDARAELQKMRRDPDPFVRTTTTIALARLGDPDAQAIVERMLQSEVPDVRLMAADAYEGQPGGAWSSAILPLLDNPDGVTRIHAARLLAPVNPDAARRTLEAAARDDNPAMRLAAVEAIAQVTTTVPAITNLSEARRLLRDRDSAIRTYAAGTLLAAARAGR